MFHPVTGKEIYSVCVRYLRKLHIMGMISDHKGMLQVYTMVFFGFSKKVRLRLDTEAAIGVIVWADICCDNPYSGFSQVRYDMRVNACDILNGYGTIGHTRLIRDYEQIKVFLQLLQGKYRVVEKYNLRRGEQVAAVLDYGTIAIQEYSGSRCVFYFTHFVYTNSTR